MPGYSQFSITVPFSTPISHSHLLLSLFFFSHSFFLNQESILYTLSQKRSAKTKWKLQQVAKLFWHSQTLLLMAWSKALRLKQQIMLFETNLILWLHLSWGDQVLLLYLSSLNYCKGDQFFSVAESSKISETWWLVEGNWVWSWFHLMGYLNLSACRETLFCWNMSIFGSYLILI